MSYEVHNSDGKPPKKIKAAKVDDKFQFELEDAVTGEHYQIILDNVGQTEAPVMLASGPDGVLYAYDYDAADGFYTLTSNTVDAAVIDNMLLAGGALAGVAALAGIAISSHSGGKHHSSSSSAATNPDDNTGVVVDDNNSSDPAVVPATKPALSDDVGNPIADGTTTNDSTPTFGGEGMQPGSTVTITDGDTVIGEVTAGDDGEWSFTPDQPLTDGEHAIVVDGTAADGSTVSDGVNIVIDAGTAEGEPEGETGSEQGAGEAEGEAGAEEGTGESEGEAGAEEGNGEPEDESGSEEGNGESEGETGSEEGTGEPEGETGSEEGTGEPEGETGSEEGTGEPEGETGSEEDNGEPEGETGSEEGTGESEGETGSEEDTRPVITDDEGNPIADGSTTTDTTPSFGGEGMQPGSTVTITDGDTVIGEVTAGDDGEWSFTPDQPLADGEHAIVVDGTAADGSTVSDGVNIVVDAGTAEGEPEGETGSEEGTGEPEGETGSEEEITRPVITDDEGNPIADGSTTTDSTPSFGGEGMQPGSTVTITDGDTVIGEVIAGDDGEWSFTPDQPLTDGEHAIVVDGTAADGSTVSDDVTIIVDAGTAEGEPEGETGSEEGTGESEGETGSEEDTRPVITDDEGNPIADGSTTTDTTPSFGGEGMQPGSTVTITDGDTVIGEVTAGDDGEWSFTPDQPLTDGEHAIVVDGTAADGSTVSDDITIIVDAGTAEGEPEGETGSEEGNGEPEGETGSEEGTGEPEGETGSEEGTGESEGETGSEEGITAPVITDDEGNPIADGSTTTDSTPSFGGEGMQPGSTVTITDGDTVIGEVIAGDDGEWNFTPDQPLADGEHAIV
ncbi:MAG: Ig-like domain-containing protein, partial [Pantoea sp.]|nr:Ig-like domain-containing protein [Pantoea sp.]